MEWLEQFSDPLWRSWVFLTTGRFFAIVLGIGFALLAIALFIASRTKWGQAKPLTKFVVVSVLLHVWLLMYAVGNRKILPQGDLNGREQNISVSFERLEQQPPALPEIASDTPTWEQPTLVDELPQPAELEELDLAALNLDDLQPPALLPAFEPTPMPALPPPEILADNAQPETTSDVSVSHDSSSDLAGDPRATPLEEFSNQDAQPASPSEPDTTEASPVVSQSSPILPPERQIPPSHLPVEYQLRQAPNRLQLTQAYGADADTEAAVEAGLKWLAQAQSPDGSWNAAAFGAGNETHALNLHRYGTGAKADSGVSGLALLAFLSAGHTHQDGLYQRTVLAGLAYLIDDQMPSGDMSGPKQMGDDPSVVNSRMYSHSIATLAVAEAYAMTADIALRNCLMKAAQYSINAQDVLGGGWRYRPKEAPGDLSQFGWQAMALKSIQRSGTQIPIEVQQRMRRFLDSCAAGSAGGLATYRPREGRPSETMTAEALACRLFMDYPLSAAGLREAKSLIMSNRPGTTEDNVYFWYYATLALFQLQDEDWRVWNQALKTRLLPTQIPAYGSQPGSWDPDGLWGGYGGRVYSTAMSCLCLEVYYRYLPLYQRKNLAQRAPADNFSR